MKNKIEIQIPNENMKMMIIGREGCNIQTFQKEMGVEVLIDDTPNTIFLLSEDSQKLERATAVMENLVANKKISPGAIIRAKRMLG